MYGFLRPTMAELQVIVESYGGTVPQLMGDGFMAIFGVPVAHEDDAERAVRAALDVRDRIRVLNRDRGGFQLPEIHAGLNVGRGDGRALGRGRRASPSSATPSTPRPGSPRWRRAATYSWTRRR